MSMGVKSMDLESLVGNVIQTTSNVGGDVGLALPLIINDAPFRGLTAGANVVLTVLGDSSVEIASIDTSQSPLTTKGDIWGYSGIDARIPIGAQDEVLTVDSAQPLGLKWADPKDNIPAFQTPWLQQIDADGFSLTDVNNIQIRGLGTLPATTIIWIAANNPNNMLFNIPINGTFGFQVDGNTTFTTSMAENRFFFPLNTKGNAIRFDGFDVFSATQHITPSAAGVEFALPTGDIFDFTINTVTEYDFSATQADFKNNKLFNVNPTTITDFTTVTAAVGDFIWIIDATDGLSKKVNASDFFNGEDNTASNVGGGVGVFKQKVLADLEFKSLLANTEILIANNVDDLAFSIGAIAISKITGLQTELDSKVDTLVNLGAGEGVGASIVGTTLNLKSVLGGTLIGLVGTANDITINTTAEINTASSSGGTESLVLAKVGSDLPFKGLTAGTNITLTPSATDITISASGEIITASNVGTGIGVFKQKVLEDLEFKSILAAQGILVNSLTNEVEIEIDTEVVEQRYSHKRKMNLSWESNNTPHAEGLGAGNLTEEGGNPTMFLDADGYYGEMISNLGMAIEHGGFFVVDSVRRDLNFDVTFKFRMGQLADSGQFVGFFELDPIVNSLTTTEHFGLVRDSSAGNTNFMISHSDGVTLTQTQIGVADLLIHTIRLVSDETNTKFQYSFDGAALVDVSTNIPAATTNLILFFENQDILGLGGVTFDLWYADGFCDK